MGYTHYFPQDRSITDLEWSNIMAASEYLIANSDVPVLNDLNGDGDFVIPMISTTEIRFNGIGDDSHETFLITKDKLPDYNFCKTAYKPYDVIVVAALLIASHYTDTTGWDVNSDGDKKDWADGFALAKTAILAVEEKRVFESLMNCLVVMERQ